MISKIKKIIKNDYLFSILQKIINILTGIITVALINRYLGTSLKGEYEYILNIVNILNIIFSFGLYSSYPFMKRRKMENQVEKYLDVFFLQALIYIFISIIISLITKNFVVVLSLVLIVLRILNTHFQNIGVVEFIKFRQILNIFVYLIDMILITIVYIFIPQNMIVLLVVLIIKYLIYDIAYIIKVRYFPKPLTNDLKFLKFLFKFGLIAMLTALLSEFNYSIDVIIMKIYLPFSEIGLYSVGSKLAQYVWLIPEAFKDVLFSRTAKDDSINEIKTILRINIFITMILIIIIIIFGKGIIYLLYGSEYLDSYLVTIIVFLGIPSMVIYKLITPLYTANGQQKKCFFVLLTSVLANIFLNFVTIPLFGKVGAAISTVISYSLCGMILFFDFTKTYKVSFKDCFFPKKADFIKLINIVKNIFSK